MADRNPYGLTAQDYRDMSAAMSEWDREAKQELNSIDMLYPASHPRTLEQAQADRRESWARRHPELAAAVVSYHDKRVEYGWQVGNRIAFPDNRDLDDREEARHAAELLAKGADE